MFERMPDEATPDDVSISWADAREANRLNWDDRASLHEKSYGIEAYVDDPTRISPARWRAIGECWNGTSVPAVYMA